MLFQRMMRAARLDVSLYEEVEADTTLTGQAAQVVGLVAICQGIGNAISVAMSAEGGAGAAVMALIGGVIGAFVGWVIWAYLTYWIGTSLFGGTATPGEMLRTIGFAQTPGILGILSFIPCLGAIAGLVGGIWALVAGIIAVRQALDFTTGKAIMTAIVGWFVMMVIIVTFALIFGVGSALMGR